MSNRRGVTLIELLVSLAILAVLLGLVAFQPPGAGRASRDDAWRRTVKASERKAMSTGRPVTTSFVQHGQVFSLTVTEDGTVVADSALAAFRSSLDSLLPASR